MIQITCSECGTTESLTSTDLPALPKDQWSLVTHGLCDDCFMLTFAF